MQPRTFQRGIEYDRSPSHLNAAVAELLAVVVAHGEHTDPGRWATGLDALAQWLAEGRPEG